MTTNGTTGDGASHDPKARHRDRMRRWVRAEKARGRCRCGKRIAEGSVSRCLVCLEQRRREERRKRGITTAGRRRRGRPLIGDFGDRGRSFEQQEQRRTWRRERQAELRRKRRI